MVLVGCTTSSSMQRAEFLALQEVGDAAILIEVSTDSTSEIATIPMRAGERAFAVRPNSTGSHALVTMGIGIAGPPPRAVMVDLGTGETFDVVARADDAFGGVCAARTSPSFFDPIRWLPDGSSVLIGCAIIGEGEVIEGRLAIVDLNGEVSLLPGALLSNGTVMSDGSILAWDGGGWLRFTLGGDAPIDVPIGEGREPMVMQGTALLEQIPGVSPEGQPTLQGIWRAGDTVPLVAPLSDDVSFVAGVSARGSFYVFSADLSDAGTRVGGRIERVLAGEGSPESRMECEPLPLIGGPQVRWSPDDESLIVCGDSTWHVDARGERFELAVESRSVDDVTWNQRDRRMLLWLPDGLSERWQVFDPVTGDIVDWPGEALDDVVDVAWRDTAWAPSCASVFCL